MWKPTKQLGRYVKRLSWPKNAGICIFDDLLWCVLAMKLSPFGWVWTSWLFLPMSDRLRKWGRAKRRQKGRKGDLQGKYPVMDAKQTQKSRDEVMDKSKQQKREINDFSCSHFSLSSSPSNELILLRGGQFQQHPSNQSRPADAYNKESVCSFLGLAHLFILAALRLTFPSPPWCLNRQFYGKQ